MSRLVKVTLRGLAETLGVRREGSLTIGITSFNRHDRDTHKTQR